MNTINPQGALAGVQRSETRDGERTESKSKPADSLTKESGKDLPQQEVKEAQVQQTKGQSPGSGDELKDQLADAVAKLNDYIQTVQRDLQFTLDESSGKSIISVVDRRSSEVIRQLPSEVTLTLAQKLNNEEPLYLFSAQV
jgi:flagellar protein FlaG